MLLIWLLCISSPVFARPLARGVPGLFGGELRTTIVLGRPPRDDEGQTLPLGRRFRDLGSALSSSIAQLPVPSASGSFGFRWDPDADTFVPIEQSLGPLLAERARPLGKGAFAVAVAYSHIEFDTIEGDDLGSLRSTQAAISAELQARLPAEDRRLVEGDRIATSLAAAVRFDNVFLAATYGVTDRIDAGLSLSINRAELRADADAFIEDPSRNGGSYFAVTQKGLVLQGDQPRCPFAFRCARDSYSSSATGTGDLYLRAKWRAVEFEWVDLALAGILSIPTGNADDLLGFHNPTFEPALILSKQWWQLEPHLNLAYAFRGGGDTSQARWVAGTDWRATDWLTLGADFLGYHDDHRDNVNDDVLQAATGLKINPFGKGVIGGIVQVPLNRDGLRADVIYTLQGQITF